MLVAGGGGVLGGEVLEQLLASHRYARVGVLASAALQPALRGLQIVVDDDAALATFAADTALIVFDRERHANGRDAVFVRPQPADLVALARRLWHAGARTLLVVVPHAPALLPHALKAGLASLDEGAVAALGFTHLVFMRMAQQGGDEARCEALEKGRRPSPPQRVAGWMLRQLTWMIPQQEQAVRAVTVARTACTLALQLPDAAAGTRVLAPEVLALAAQGNDPATLVAEWLAGRPLSHR